MGVGILKFYSRLLSSDSYSTTALFGFIVVALVFCFDALVAPFWGDDDIWSNLLPVVHYRRSILVDHAFPIYTDLWYGGRSQWTNPLSSILYIPSVIIWLLFPLRAGVGIVMVGHLIFALYAGWMLSGDFLKDGASRFAIAVLVVSPVFPSLAPGHFEKIMSWPWILLGLHFLFSDALTSVKKGLYAGLCLAVVPLTGANYYAFYAGILYVLIVLGRKSLEIFFALICGALPGLLHLPFVWHLLGEPRAMGLFDPQNTMGWIEVFLSVAVGWVRPIEWEKQAVLGFPLVGLFVFFLWRFLTKFRENRSDSRVAMRWMILTAIVLFAFLTVGLAYSKHQLLDTFRVPVRAIAFFALSMMLFTLLGVRDALGSFSSRRFGFVRLLLLASMTYAFGLWWWARPIGTAHSPQLADELVSYLKSQAANSVWFSTEALDEMFIDVALNLNGISLPNVYYGDMNQIIPVEGNYCGYSFDYLLSGTVETRNSSVLLYSELDRDRVLGNIPVSRLEFASSFLIAGKHYDLYKVVCHN